MPKVMLATLVLCLLAFGCEDNEISFYVEHAKAQPEAPTCEVSESDGFASYGILDLAFGSSYGGSYLVKNALMSREDYGNLRAETNGIFIDGMEVYVRQMDGSMVGSTEYYEFEHYLAPEETGLAHAVAVPASITQGLADNYGCLLLNDSNYPQDTITYDVNGQRVPRSLDSVYTVVRFLGHSQGGSDVQTPEFTFLIHLCCGCLVDWDNCGNGCSAFCEEPEGHGMCTMGVGNGGAEMDCRMLYHNTGARWGECSIDEADPDAGTRQCNCDDDCGAAS